MGHVRALQLIAGYALALSDIVVPLRALPAKCGSSLESTVALRIPFAYKFHLKINFSLICLQMCIFFCTFAR